ncbi:hypothetical protein GCM10008955_42330 [Deinococcus malanensis]|uniref:Knr4/Smi1-like domain-containing protein n=1 Tax=Deinococcus malanensis TaxID=1706855 RepID=A0ABQ2F5T9_9DEIO|nr:SMI1/KNR4 family protein [Deinococcus malanensis]GGK44077.1 hypothetical protein GCM10008955_42330 [Deinococcus malanensis]
MSAYDDLCDALEAHGVPVRSRLNPPAQTHDLDRVRALLPAPPPSAWESLYALHDGEGDHGIEGTLLGLKFMPLHDVLRWLLDMQMLIDQGFPENDGPNPDPRVSQHFPSLGLLPVFDDTTGNSLGIDLQPGPEGKAGQVVIFGADYDGAQYVCADLVDLFLLLLREVNMGALVVTPHPGQLPEARLQGVTGVLMDWLA